MVVLFLLGLKELVINLDFGVAEFRWCYYQRQTRYPGLQFISSNHISYSILAMYRKSIVIP